MSSVSLDDLRRLCGYRPPLRTRPRCEHVAFDGRTCSRPALHECDPGPDGQRPRYVCGRCLAYQVAGIGPVVLADEIAAVRFDGEGRITTARRRARP